MATYHDYETLVICVNVVHIYIIHILCIQVFSLHPKDKSQGKKVAGRGKRVGWPPQAVEAKTGLERTIAQKKSNDNV